jgi:hypothetical protein
MLKGVSPTLPSAKVKVGLITTAPTDRTGASMVEAVGGSYARQDLTFANIGSISDVSGSGTTAVRGMSNTPQISFTNMPACTVVGVAVWDDAGSPNFLYYADLQGGNQVVAGGATFNLPGTNLLFEEL